MKDLIQNKYLKYLSIQKKDCIYRFSIKNQFKKDDDEDLQKYEDKNQKNMIWLYNKRLFEEDK